MRTKIFGRGFQAQIMTMAFYSVVLELRDDIVRMVLDAHLGQVRHLRENALSNSYEARKML